MPLEGLQLGYYRLARLIGSGGMGEVYLAEDTRINRQVAIKVVRTEAAPHSDAYASKGDARLFHREMKAIAALDHSHILPLYDFGEENINNATLTYMVMPFRREGSLADWLQQHGSSELLSPLDIWHLIQQAASALQHAHNRQIIHQDVKPSNFLIHRNDEHPNRPDLLLADFGIAKFTSATSSMSQTIRGTPTYMAPEQWSGEPVAATDQYALAIMAYELLTGRPPFQGPPMRLMHLHATTLPQPPSALHPRISPALDTVILRALAKQPEGRFPSISAFAQAFQQALQSTDMSTVVKPPHIIHAEEITLPIDADSGDKTIPISNPKLLAATPTTPNFSGTPGSNFFGVKSILLISLVLFVLVGSIGFFYLLGINHIVPNHTGTIATTPVNATATFIAANPNPYPPHRGKLVLYDPLSSNSNVSNWLVPSPDPYGACEFTGGAYHISQSRLNYYFFCNAQATDFSNFVYQVQMTIVKGDTGGIVFRIDNTSSKFYYFHISRDGSYGLDLYMDNLRKDRIPLKSGSSSAINPNLYQTNLIAVVAIDNNFDLYVNNTRIASVTDNNSTYSHGQIGVIADAVNNPTEVVFSNAKVWTL